MERRRGIEPQVHVLCRHSPLHLGHGARWSEWSDSNRRSPQSECGGLSRLSHILIGRSGGNRTHIIPGPKPGAIPLGDTPLPDVLPSTLPPPLAAARIRTWAFGIVWSARYADLVELQGIEPWFVPCHRTALPLSYSPSFVEDERIELSSTACKAAALPLS